MSTIRNNQSAIMLTLCETFPTGEPWDGNDLRDAMSEALIVAHTAHNPGDRLRANITVKAITELGQLIAAVDDAMTLDNASGDQS